MQFVLQQIVSMLEELLRRTEKKPRPRQTRIRDNRPLEAQIEPLRGRYGPAMIKDFILYWDERERTLHLGEDGIEYMTFGKSRWEKEKTWDIEKRLERWKRQDEKWQYEKEVKRVKVEEKPVPRGRPGESTGPEFIGGLFEKYKN